MTNGSFRSTPPVSAGTHSAGSTSAPVIPTNSATTTTITPIPPPTIPPAATATPPSSLAQRFQTHEANFKSTWRPRHNVTLVARYAYQSLRSRPGADNLDRLTTADITSHIAGASLSWIPLARLYLQGNLNYVFDRTDTPAAAISNAVLDARNDYWTTSLVAGLAVDNKTDLTGSYFFYRADNYVDNSTAGLPSTPAMKNTVFKPPLAASSRPHPLLPPLRLLHQQRFHRRRPARFRRPPDPILPPI
jgi:hypothetical protein